MNNVKDVDMPSKKKILITGAAGRLGQLLIKALKDQYTIRAVDIIPLEGPFEFVRADITDLKSTQEIVKDIKIDKVGFFHFLTNV